MVFSSFFRKAFMRVVTALLIPPNTMNTPNIIMNTVNRRELSSEGTL